MHFAFVDITYGYAVDRPEAPEALGGTTTALCFLARALRADGHDCTIFNKVSAPTAAHGIASLPLEQLTTERSNLAYDVFIFVGRWADWLVTHIAEAARVPLIAWMHESQFDLPFVPQMDAFNAVVFVSDWQARINQATLLPQQSRTVIRNALSPAIAALFPPDRAITANKTPTAVYVGATPRGLLHLPTLWPLLQAVRPDLTLQIFANPAPSRDTAINASLAEQLRALPGVTHLGQVGQPALAQALAEASFFLAPNPFPETSCIALMEALAAGLCAITTDRAALPETAHGFATLCPIAAADDPALFTQPFDAAAFAARALPVIADRCDHPAVWEPRLREQVSYFQTHYR
nr:glycosyltransferase family 4 protein [Alphaproteobacteria bacterium]